MDDVLNKERVFFFISLGVFWVFDVGCFDRLGLNMEDRWVFNDKFICIVGSGISWKVFYKILMCVLSICICIYLILSYGMLLCCMWWSL